MNKSWASMAGFALIVLGVIALVWGGISYTTQKKVIDIGPLQATTEQHKTIPLSPLLGVGALIGGIVLVVSSRGNG
jgi:drug/metabolite transporter (DMT)-like permease